MPATDKEYTTEEKIENFLGGISIASGDADEFILAAQKFIDSETGRNFKADDEASARLFDGDDTQNLVIDDCIEITLVEVGQDTYGDSKTTVPEMVPGVTTDGYIIQPANRDDGDDDNIIPIHKLCLRERVWTGGVQNHSITAKWGYSEAVPDDLSQAATVIAAGMYNFHRGSNTGLKSEKIGNYSVSYGADGEKGGSFGDLKNALAVLVNYKKILF